MPKVYFSGQGFDVHKERLKKCVQERSDKFSVCHGGVKGSGRGMHPTLVQEDHFLLNDSLGSGLLQAEATQGTSAEKAQK